MRETLPGGTPRVGQRTRLVIREAHPLLVEIVTATAQGVAARLTVTSVASAIDTTSCRDRIEALIASDLNSSPGRRLPARGSRHVRSVRVRQGPGILGAERMDGA